MNDFWDNFSKLANETAKKAMKASGDVVELTKTSLNIRLDEIKRESFFKEIGKIVYNTYKNSPGSASDEVLDFCKCIDEIENSINSHKSKAAQIKNKKFCVNCGAQLPKEVTYCYSCGAKQPEIIEEDESCCDDDSCCCSGTSDTSENKDNTNDKGDSNSSDSSDCGCSGSDCGCNPDFGSYSKSSENNDGGFHWE
ncbi:MAG: zinc ribbon domain-containing protein [Oscillospiraceae bacterium]|nr:zinc ribbon domain-containing protein [Oscillospiraceae bacterium]